MVEHFTDNEKVEGSIPSTRTTQGEVGGIGMVVPHGRPRLVVIQKRRRELRLDAMKNYKEGFPDQSVDPEIRELLIKEAPQLTPQIIRRILETRRGLPPEISVGGESISLERKLGSGGSKEVYDIQIGDLHYALAIPGNIDSAEIVADKWQRVLREPISTTRLRDAGFRVNPLSELIGVELDGISFPALIMRRYEDLPFDVRDAKNPRSSIYREKIRSFDVDKDLERIGETIKSLAQKNIKTGGDSFNLFVDGEGLDLYFNDLGSCKFEEIPADKLKGVLEYYAMAASAALMNGFSEEEYSVLKDSLDEDELIEKISSKIT